MDHPKPKSATEGTVLGPFHTHDAVTVSHGDNISRDVNGEPLLVACTIRDTKGRPLSGVKVDIWETDSTGHYDVQYEGYSGPDGRCLLETDDEGVFWFKAIVPVSYPSMYKRWKTEGHVKTLALSLKGVHKNTDDSQFPTMDLWANS